MIKWLKKKLPSRREIKQYRGLGIFGRVLHRKGLWRFDHHSLAIALAIGLFWAWMPMPFQMIPAACCAILFGANLPLSLAGVWLSNPITMPAMLFFCYKLGDLILGSRIIHSDGSLAWYFHHMHVIWKPLLLGCLIMGVLSAMIGFFTIQLLWKLNPKSRN